MMMSRMMMILTIMMMLIVNNDGADADAQQDVQNHDDVNTSQYWTSLGFELCRHLGRELPSLG